MKQFLFKATAYVPVPKTVEGRVTASSYAVAAARAARSALKHDYFKRKRFDASQGMTLRIIPAGAVLALLLFFAPAAHAAVIGAAPIESIPNYGIQTKPEQWNRTYAQYASGTLITPPHYDIKELTSRTVKDLVQDRDHATGIIAARATRLLTAKLFYSTRYCGTYDLDAGENIPGSKHCAIDLKAPKGTPIHAVVAGKVIKDQESAEIFGTHVVIQTATGDTWLYAHMEKTAVRVGRRVRAGAVIGYVGLTGSTSGYHLHLELKDKNGKDKTPVPFLPY